MYHMLSNAASDYLISPIMNWLVLPVANSAVGSFVGDWGGRWLVNTVADWGGRAAVNAVANNPHIAVGTAAALYAGKKAMDHGYTPAAGVARAQKGLTAFQDSRKKAPSLKDEAKGAGAGAEMGSPELHTRSHDRKDERGRSPEQEGAPTSTERRKSKSPSPTRRGDGSDQ